MQSRADAIPHTQLLFTNIPACKSQTTKNACRKLRASY